MHGKGIAVVFADREAAHEALTLRSHSQQEALCPGSMPNECLPPRSRLAQLAIRRRYIAGGGSHASPQRRLRRRLVEPRQLSEALHGGEVGVACIKPHVVPATAGGQHV